MKLTPHDETMMLKTPFHSRCEAACEINMWEDWKGYTSAQAYTEVEKEYFAVRNATGVFDNCQFYLSDPSRSFKSDLSLNPRYLSRHQPL